MSGIGSKTPPVPPADSADNNTVSDVVGNKTDTTAGDSLYSGIANLSADHLVPAQDSADNNTFAEVIGNKTDTQAGTSIMALLKLVNETVGQKTTKALTFANDTGTVSLFTVTGDVRVNIIAICKTNVASAAAANIRMGVSGNDQAMISDTLATDLDANEFWNDQSPTSNIQAGDRVRSYDISNGDDVILTLDAQVDSGAITFYCLWTPLSSDGNVTAA